MQFPSVSYRSVPFILFYLVLCYETITFQIQLTIEMTVRIIPNSKTLSQEEERPLLLSIYTKITMSQATEFIMKTRKNYPFKTHTTSVTCIE